MNRLGRSVLTGATILGLTACGPGGSGSAAGSYPTVPGSNSTCASATTVAGPNNGPETSPPGDIPDDQAFVAYASPDNLYTVKVPEGWARTESATGVTFTDKLNAIDVVVVNRPAAPTVDSVRTDEVLVLAASAPCFHLGAVKTAERTAGMAVVVTYTADSSPDAVTGKVVNDDVERYEFWKDGKAVVLTLLGSAGSDNVDPWRIVTDSFAWR
ncbi:MAG: hypothetical protein QOG43_1655 [Actinomycetota bacterium]|jgi:hypothetical protein|nr:hypothetical protein [Actinomycetota bacterium]